MPEWLVGALIGGTGLLGGFAGGAWAGGRSQGLLLGRMTSSESTTIKTDATVAKLEVKIEAALAEHARTLTDHTAELARQRERSHLHANELVRVEARLSAAIEALGDRLVEEMRHLRAGAAGPRGSGG